MTSSAPASIGWRHTLQPRFLRAPSVIVLILWPAFIALCISHGVSFVMSVSRGFRPKPLGRHAALMPNPPQGQSVMLAPYGRVVVMHVTIIFGAILAEALGSNIWAFMLLIVLKTAVDIAAHVRKNFSE